MAKIGPKEAQRIALREAKAKPRKAKSEQANEVNGRVVSVAVSDRRQRQHESAPALAQDEAQGIATDGVVVLPDVGPVPVDEARRAVVQYRKHREKSRIAVAAYDKREREKRKREGK